MDIDIRARNADLNNLLRSHIDRQFGKIARQVSPLALLHLELTKERNPANRSPNVAKAILHLKGSVLTAQEESLDMVQSVDMVADKLSRQVRHYLDRRRGPRH